MVREQVQGRVGDTHPNRVTLYSGRCEGGPYDTKPIYHGEPVIKVAIDANSNKVVTYFGLPNLAIKIGEYRYSEGKWVWSF